MAVAQRYPRDYEGIIANYPALEFVGLMMRVSAFSQALYGPGRLHQLGQARQPQPACCRRLRCAGRPGRRPDQPGRGLPLQPGRALRCWLNIDLGSSCLTDAQLRTVRALSDDMPLGFPLAQGLSSAPPFGILYGANFAGPLDIGTWPFLLDPPVLGLNGYIASMDSEYLKHFITRDPAYPSLQFDPVNAGPWQARVQAVSALHDATSVDLTEFMQRGGKILMMHGTSDTVVPFSVSVRYVDRLRQALGNAAVDSFLRFYGVAGMGHGEGRYTLAWKSLDMLEDWVERGNAPVDPVSRNVLRPVRPEPAPVQPPDLSALPARRRQQGQQLPLREP